MLFNSYTYIFAFLPAAVLGYFALGRWAGISWANGWLVAASFFFYGYWNSAFLPLLACSILVNYAVSRGIVRCLEAGSKARARVLFALGMAFDMGSLCYYKYMDFIIENVNLLLGTDFALWHVLMPLGISFFSITQMVYLIGVHFYGDGKKYKNFIDYCLFVSFFPHLLAGPILYHKSMMKQFANEALHHPKAENFMRGLALFVIGLAKKVLIADELIEPVADGFFHAGEIAFFESWALAVCFCLQMYFDFSGYTDMAVGVARMMNLEIPVNFNKPFRAHNVSEFWSRWHMSLTTTITAYIYTPMLLWFGKVTLPRSMLALVVTMVVIGIWHGAGWTYVVFGAVQGVALCVNQIWKRQKRLCLPDSLCYAMTLLFAASSCVMFRAESVAQALQVYRGMFGMRGFDWPFTIGGGQLFKVLNAPGLHDLPLAVIFVGLWIVLTWDTESNEIVRRMKPGAAWAVFLAALFVVSVLHFTQVTAFLYFQF